MLAGAMQPFRVRGKAKTKVLAQLVAGSADQFQGRRMPMHFQAPVSLHTPLLAHMANSSLKHALPCP